MDKLLFIIDSYLPDPSSNGACVAQIVEAMENKYDVHVLAIVNQNYVSKNIHYIKSKRTSSSLLSRLFSCAEDSKIVNDLEEKAIDLINSLDIKKIVCVYRPIECILTGLRLKRKYGEKINVSAYFLDNIGEMLSDSWIKEKIFLLNQKKCIHAVVDLFDSVIALRYYQKSFGYFLGTDISVKYVGIPNINRSLHSMVKVKGEKRRIVYTGSFYPNFRNPEKMLKILELFLIENSDIEIHFYSWGCEEIIEQVKERFPFNIFLHGKVPVQEAHDAIKNADILLNVGNDLPNQVPGKLLEYISTGKPIIHYSFRKDDPAIVDCEHYGNCLILSEEFDDIEEMNRLLKSETIISMDRIETLFKDSTPNYFINLIE